MATKFSFSGKAFHQSNYNVPLPVQRRAEVFVEALRYEAVFIILIHNHPSGDPTPSRQDVEITLDIFISFINLCFESKSSRYTYSLSRYLVFSI